MASALSARPGCFGLTGILLLLAGCHGGTSGTSSQNTPSANLPAFLATSDITFQRHAYTGYSGAAAISPDSPPHPVAGSNDGNGNLTVANLSGIGLGGIYAAPRAAYDIRSADFNGDGIPDVISTVYSPTSVTSTAWLFLGNASGVYQQDPTFGVASGAPGSPGFRGRTETIVVADFTNDGAVDIFLPTYTYLDARFDLSDTPAFLTGGATPPNVYNAYQSYLLLNDGTGHFSEQAVAAGVSMHSRLSGITPDSSDPDGNQPEGVQAVDLNMDGLIDLYAGGHMYINQGVDDHGIPHFKDMAPEWGLTPDILRAAPPWAPNVSNQIPANYLVTDEGAKFIDWSNDGHLDLLLYRWGWGPAHGARLFEFSGSGFTERLYAQGSATATCKQPPPRGTPLFQSTRAYTTASDSAGINSYDLGNDGLEDVVVSGDASGSAVFHNTGCGFVEISAGDLTHRPGSSGGVAFADFDGDGRIDVLYGESSGYFYYLNRTPSAVGHAFSVEVLGPNGERNQFGRVIQVFPPGSQRIYTRVVDGGSGYLSQNQYPILVGTPFSGAHTVVVYFAPLTKCAYKGPSYAGPYCTPVMLKFSIQPGQHALAYAPSSAHPGGAATVLAGLH